MKTTTAERMRPGLGKRFPLSSWIIMLPGSIIIALLLELSLRRSIPATFSFIATNPLGFLLGCAVVALTLAIALMFRKRLFTLTLVGILWTAVGIANFLVMLHRTGQPLSAADLKVNTAAIMIAPVYYKWWQLVGLGLLIASVLTGLVLLAVKSPKYRRNLKRAFLRLAASALALCALLFICWEGGYVKRSLKPSLYRSYMDYGFAWCFAYSVFDTGIREPVDYSSTAVSDIGSGIDISVETTEEPPADHGFVEEFREFVRSGLFNQTPEIYSAEAVETIETLVRSREEHESSQPAPNFIFIQLESFFDPLTLTDFEIEGDPIPCFRSLSEKYTSGKLSVPTVSGGTANTEFEVLTGCNLDFFGAGEMPFYTVAKDNVCESLAADLKTRGLYSTLLHNYTGSFYGRNTVYSNLCFDRFVSVEYMNGYDVTQKGWAKDSILTKYILDSLSTTDERDFVYVVTVQSHGAYPALEGEAPRFNVTRAPGDSEKASMEYYLNQIYEVDGFIRDLTQALQSYEEPVMLVMYGDHLPGLGFEAENLADGDLYSTPYVIWTNYEAEKADADIEAYQLGAYALGLADVHSGVMVRFHQNRMGQPQYMEELEVLEYDIMYGKRYVYGGKELSRTSEMRYGIEPITIMSVYQQGENLFVSGSGFTADSVIYQQEKSLDTIFVNDTLLIAPGSSAADGPVQVCQIAADNAILSSAQLEEAGSPAQ